MTEDREELQVEATGETVGEAKWQALRQLEALSPGIDRGGVRFQVVAEGERGLLGVGYSPARVVASAARRSEAMAPPPATFAEKSHAADATLELLAGDLVKRITSALQIECSVRLSETDETLLVSCSGPDLGLLIGRRGQTIDAVQYIVNAAVFRNRSQEAKEVVVDAAGYRARRRETLEALAVESAERAAAGAPVELEAMPAAERKIVHTRLQEYPGVETASEGTDPNRYVVIRPAAGG